MTHRLNAGLMLAQWLLSIKAHGYKNIALLVHIESKQSDMKKTRTIARVSITDPGYKFRVSGSALNPSLQQPSYFLLD